MPDKDELIQSFLNEEHTKSELAREIMSMVTELHRTHLEETKQLIDEIIPADWTPTKPN